MRSDESIWRVIFITADAARLDGAQRLLEREGFLVRRRAAGNAPRPGGTFELVVPRSEAREARACLLENNLH